MQNLLKKIYNSKKTSIILTVISHSAVILTALAAIPLVYFAFCVSKWSVLKIILITGVPFLLVTLLRRAINAPRPYELYDFYKVAPKNKKGRSFPSRHAYSAFVIGTSLVFASPILGSAIIALGVLMCICRVLLGIHFIRDVLAGALIGIASAVIGVLTTAPF